MAEAPYRAGSGAPLEVEVDLGAKMKWTRYRLDADALRIESKAGVVPPKQVVLAEVTRVELATVGGVTICMLHLRDGGKASVSSGLNLSRDPTAARTFATLLEALNERIAVANPQATFTTGSWWLGGSVLAMAVIGGAALALLARDPDFRDLLKFKIACVMLAIMLVVAVPLAFVRGRPKPYDPHKIPRRYDPFSSQ